MTDLQKIIFGIKEGMEKLGILVNELDRQTNPKGSWEKPELCDCEVDERGDQWICHPCWDKKTKKVSE